MSELYGLDREINERIKQKYDPVAEQDAIHWISEILGVPEPQVVGTDGDTLYSFLKSGVLLCQLINAIKSDTIPRKKFSTNPTNILQEKQNIEVYLEGCKLLGVPSQDMFLSGDLVNRNAIPSVLLNIFALGRQAQVIETFKGPKLGVTYNVTPEEQNSRKTKRELEKQHAAELERKRSEAQIKRRLELENEQIQEKIEEFHTTGQRKLTRRLSKGRISPDDFRQKSAENLRQYMNLKEKKSELPPEIKIGAVTYGLDRELEQKRKQKYDFNKEEQVMDWIETVTGSKIDSFYESLRDGIVLCNLANKLKPGMITRINTRNTTLAHRDNIQLYLSACTRFGVHKNNLFGVSDLYEQKDLEAVVNHFFSLNEQLKRLRIFTGPFLGLDGSLTKQEAAATTKHSRSMSVGSGVPVAEFSAANNYQNAIATRTRSSELTPALKPWEIDALNVANAQVAAQKPPPMERTDTPAVIQRVNNNNSSPIATINPSEQVKREPTRPVENGKTEEPKIPIVSDKVQPGIVENKEEGKKGSEGVPQVLEKKEETPVVEEKKVEIVEPPKPVQKIVLHKTSFASMFSPRFIITSVFSRITSLRFAFFRG